MKIIITFIYSLTIKELVKIIRLFLCTFFFLDNFQVRAGFGLLATWRDNFFGLSLFELSELREIIYSDSLTVRGWLASRDGQRAGTPCCFSFRALMGVHANRRKFKGTSNAPHSAPSIPLSVLWRLKLCFPRREFLPSFFEYIVYLGIYLPVLKNGTKRRVLKKDGIKEGRVKRREAGRKGRCTEPETQPSLTSALLPKLCYGSSIPRTKFS